MGFTLRGSLHHDPDIPMELRKIFSGRLDSLANGGEASYPLTPRAGGRMCKVVNYQVKVIQHDGSDNIRLSVELRHSPDGTASALHSLALNGGNPGTTLPALLSGDADTTRIIGEVLHPILKIKHNSAGGAVWAMVEVFELRKPF